MGGRHSGSVASFGTKVASDFLGKRGKRRGHPQDLSKFFFLILINLL